MRAAPFIALPATVALLASGAACNEILGLDAREPFPAEAGAPTGGGGDGGSICEPEQVEDCYSGVPASTEDVGICKGGTRTCNADGTSYGACVEEVTPQPADDCAVIGDEDCDGSGCSDPLWSKIFGDSSDQGAGVVGTDGSGNVYVAGTFQGTVQFGQTTLISAGSSDIFLAKLSPEGEPLWSKRFGDAAEQVASGIAVAADGVVALVGHFQGTLTFGGAPLVSAGGTDVFVAKLDAAGEEIWSKRYGDMSSQNGRDVATDFAGNVVITGDYYGAIDFGDGDLPPPVGAGNRNVFLAKLSSDAGNGMWSKGFGGGFDTATAVAVDGSDSVLAAGNYGQTIDFGTGMLTSVGSSDMYLVKFDAQGVTSWAQSFGGSADDNPDDIAVDSSGSILVAGSFRETVNFGGATMTSAGSLDVCVAKLTTAGNHVWSKSFGDASGQLASSIAAGPGGSVVLRGRFSGSVDFGGGVLVAGGAPNIFLATLDDQGDHLWSKRFGDSAQNDRGRVAIDSAGNVLLTGSTSGTIDFGNGPLSTAGGLDFTLAKFAR